MRRLDEDLRHIPVPPLDLNTIVRRGERLLARRKAVFAGLSVATVVAVAIGATWVALLTPRDPDMNVGPARLENTVDVNVYLDDGISPKQREDVQNAARSLEGVVTLRYVSKSDAFAEFKEIYRTQPEFWENLPPDALPARLVVTLESNVYVSDVTRALSGMAGVDEVIVAERRTHETDDLLKDQGDRKDQNECGRGVEGKGLEVVESYPPRPYFEAFNLWRTTTNESCLDIAAGQQIRGTGTSDPPVIYEPNGWLFISGDHRHYDKGIGKEEVPLPRPVRILGFSGKGYAAVLRLQSLRDCSTIAYDVGKGTFGPDFFRGIVRCPKRWP